MYIICILQVGYNRGQSSSASPRGYGSTGSTPHSNGSSYSSTMNGYHGGAGSLGNMVGLPSQSPSHPPSVPNAGSAPGIFSFSPVNMISAVKQKSAFAPVLRPGLGASGYGSSPTPSGAITVHGMQSGWAHQIYC
ncbi:hypothetical protein CHS0354_006159, partial [Potamilus streckersoni]